MERKIIAAVDNIIIRKVDTGYRIKLKLPAMSEHRLFCVLPRLARVRFNLHLLNSKEVIRRIVRANPALKKIIDPARQEGRFVFYQTRLAKGSEHFVAMVGEQWHDHDERQIAAFRSRALRQLNAYNWREGQRSDIVINMDIVSSVASFKEFGEKRNQVYYTLLRQKYIDDQGRTLTKLFGMSRAQFIKKFALPGLTTKDKDRIYEILEPDIYINGKYYSFKTAREEPLLNRIFKRKLSSQKNLYDVLDTTLDPRNDFIDNTQALEANARLLAMISDLHLGDHTGTDNFRGKVQDFIEYIDEVIIKQGIPLVILGDMFEGLQAKFEDIIEAYPEVFAALRKVLVVIYVPGNHDRRAYEDEKLYALIKKLIPNVRILPNFYYSYNTLDVYGDHGSIPDTFNNVSYKGDFIAKAVKLLERLTVDPKTGRSHIEQTLMSFAEKYCMTNKTLAKSNVVKYLDYCHAVVSMYMYFNKDKLTVEKQRDLLLILGHTHQMFRHNEPNNLLQQTFYKIIDKFPDISRKIRPFLVNTGAWSGEDFDKNGISAPKENIVILNTEDKTILYRDNMREPAEVIPLQR
jgi:UDP-2,3-diacylglucosamine pyrophosphatase LpxH